MEIRVLAKVVTPNFDEALTAFADSASAYGAFAPSALYRQVLAGRVTRENLEQEVTVANEAAVEEAGECAPQFAPAGMYCGKVSDLTWQLPGKAMEVACAASDQDFPEFGKSSLAVVFGSGRSQVALLCGQRECALVVWVPVNVLDDESTWAGRITPVEDIVHKLSF